MLHRIELFCCIQKLKVLKIKKLSAQCPSITPDWNYADNEMIEGMRIADKQVLKNHWNIGMLLDLQQGNVIRKGDNLVYFNRAV